MTTTIGIWLMTDQQHLNSLAMIKERLITKFDPTPASSWVLDHRLLRSAAASTNDKSPPRFQHILSLGHRPGKLYVAVNPAQPAQKDVGSKDTVITIRPQQGDAFFNLLKERFGALWTFRSRLSILNGVEYNVGEFKIRLGELRQISGQQQTVRAVICCIETSSMADGGDNGPGSNGSATRAALSDLWAAIGFANIKEAFGTYPIDSTTEEGFDEVRLWCDVLRLRG